MDEKIFTIEEQYNCQNNKIYGKTSHEGQEKVPRVHSPSPLLRRGLLGVVPLRGDTSSFLSERCENWVRMYQEDVLLGVVKPLNITLFSGQEWVFQQDSAPAHKAKTTQEWLRRNVPAFISAEDWPSGSPDLNPLDYKLWAVLDDMACQKRRKRSLVKAASETLLGMVHMAITD